jgi:hypothetical protein
MNPNLNPSHSPKPVTETSAGELARLRNQASRLQLLQSKTKLFCPTCKKVESVVDAFANLECKLQCGHRREIERGLAQRIAKLEHEVGQ